MSCFICSNCSDVVNHEIENKSCTLISEHLPVFCPECNKKCADWKLVTKKISEPTTDVNPDVNADSDIPVLMQRYPDAITEEYCSHCGETVEIKAYGRQKCPTCGASILPCSMCTFEMTQDCDNCPYKVRA